MVLSAKEERMGVEEWSRRRREVCERRDEEKGRREEGEIEAKIVTREHASLQMEERRSLIYV